MKTSDLEFFDADKLNMNVKATIRKNGRLGFSMDAMEELELRDRDGVLIGKDEENNLVLQPADADPRAFKICSGGDYVFAKTKDLWNKLGVDYKDERVIFDLVEKDGYYEMRRRPAIGT